MVHFISGKLELVDVRSKITGFTAREGMKTWKVYIITFPHIFFGYITFSIGGRL